MRCARYGCQNEVSPNPKARFCSSACRVADHKRRKRAGLSSPWVSAATGDAPEAFLVSQDANPDTQVVAAVHESIALRNTFNRLSRDARPELGVRCDGMAKAIGDGLTDYFGGAVEDG